jgi:hypothetical protein
MKTLAVSAGSLAGRTWPALTLGLIILLAGAVAGCGSPPAGTSGPTTAALTPSESPASTPFLSAAPGWSQSRPDAAWKQALRNGVVPLSRHRSLVPIALAGDGQAFFAAMYSTAYSGVVWVDATTGRFSRIHRFRNPRTDQAFGSFDGRWLVWNESHSPYGGSFTVWSWDTYSGIRRQIGAPLPTPSSADEGGPTDPYTRDGLATWTQGYANGSRTSEVHVVDLANGRDRVVFRGSAGPSVLLPGQRVVWAVTTKTGVTVLRAADARTGRRVALPSALRTLRCAAAAGFVTDGTALLYSDADASWQSLWWSPQLGETPQRLFHLTQGADHFDNSLAVAGRYLCFGVSAHTYLADTTARRYLQLSPGGWALMDSKAMVLLTQSAKKARHAMSDVIFLPLDSLPPMPH